MFRIIVASRSETVKWLMTRFLLDLGNFTGAELDPRVDHSPYWEWTKAGERINTREGMLSRIERLGAPDKTPQVTLGWPYYATSDGEDGNYYAGDFISWQEEQIPVMEKVTPDDVRDKAVYCDHDLPMAVSAAAREVHRLTWSGDPGVPPTVTVYHFVQGKAEQCQVFVPAHTHCSQDGLYAGVALTGKAFWTRGAADLYLKAFPNPGDRWGDGNEILELELPPGGPDRTYLTRASIGEIEAEIWRRGKGSILRPLCERA